MAAALVLALLGWALSAAAGAAVKPTELEQLRDVYTDRPGPRALLSTEGARTAQRLAAPTRVDRDRILVGHVPGPGTSSVTPPRPVTGRLMRVPRKLPLVWSRMGSNWSIRLEVSRSRASPVSDAVVYASLAN